jgi:hypothetical protein
MRRGEGTLLQKVSYDWGDLSMSNKGQKLSNKGQKLLSFRRASDEESGFLPAPRPPRVDQGRKGHDFSHAAKPASPVSLSF